MYLNKENIVDGLKSPYILYATIVLVILNLSYVISLSAENRQAYKIKLASLPIISTILLLCFILSLYNLYPAMLIILCLCITLAIPAKSATVEHFDSLRKANENNEDDEDDEDVDEVVSEKDKKTATKVLNAPNHTTATNDGDESFDEEPVKDSNKKEAPVSNYLGKSMGLYDNKYSDIFNAAVQENKKAIQKRMKTVRNNNKKHKGGNEGLGATGKRENYKDTGNNLSIQRRKFNLNDESDKDLLNTREICTDVINRINYEYEDTEYLKKYISARIEEIIEINKLLDD